MSCQLVNNYQHFKRAQCLHCQDQVFQEQLTWQNVPENMNLDFDPCLIITGFIVCDFVLQCLIRFSVFVSASAFLLIYTKIISVQNSGCQREILSGFWWGNLKKRDHFIHMSLACRTISISILNKQDGRMWSAFVWLGTGTSCMLLQLFRVMTWHNTVGIL